MYWLVGIGIIASLMTAIVVATVDAGRAGRALCRDHHGDGGLDARGDREGDDER